MKKLIITLFFFSSSAFALLPLDFYIEGASGFSVARQQNGFVLDANNNRNEIKDYAFSRTAPLYGVGIGYYLHFFSLGLFWSQRVEQTGSGLYQEDSGSIQFFRMSLKSERLLFNVRLLVDALLLRDWTVHPYLIGGVGVAWNDLGPLNLGNTGTASTTSVTIAGHRVNNAAYQLGGGFSVLMLHHAFAYLQYNFIWAGDIVGGRHVNVRATLKQAYKAKLYTNEVWVGLGLIL